MKQLLEAYRTRIIHLNEMLNTTSNNGGQNDIRKIERLKTKRSCYRSLIAELEKEKQALKAPEMSEALKAVRLELGMIEHNWDYRTKEFMPDVIKILKELES